LLPGNLFDAVGDALQAVILVGYHLRRIIREARPTPAIAAIA
jgi:hypothetical protein